jgi:hypothetical protein
MTTTPLGFQHVANNQNQPEVPINNLADNTENSIHAREIYTITGDRTLTQDEFTKNFHHVLNANAGSPTEPSASWTLTVPAFTKSFSVENNTGFNVTIASVGAGASVILAATRSQLFNTDAVDVFALSSAVATPGTLGTFTVPVFVQGKSSVSELLCLFTPIELGDFRIKAGATGSSFEGAVNATALTTYSLKKNGTEFGTAQVAASASSGTFTVASDTDFTFAAKDKLTIVAPGTPDATHGDFMIHLKTELI